MHCIAKHVPANSAGELPVVHLRSPDGGESFLPGQVVEVTWISDDDDATTAVDLALSLDAGLSFAPLALAEPDDGHYAWTVPDLFSANALIRVTAHDADQNTASDASDATFTIAGTPCPADLDASGDLTLDDVALFTTSPPDLTGDTAFTLDDVTVFVDSFLAGCP